MRQRAHAFRVEACDDPTCGPHIIGEDRNGNDLCEITISCDQALLLIKEFQRILYEKATQRGGFNGH
jgi:hypothetical protein